MQTFCSDVSKMVILPGTVVVVVFVVVVVVVVVEVVAETSTTPDWENTFDT